MLYECLDSLDIRLFYSCSCWPIIGDKLCITHNQTNANWFESWWTLLLFIYLCSNGVEWNCNGSFHTADLQLGDVNLKVFNIIKGINESKTDLFHVNADMNLMIENVIWSKNGITNIAFIQCREIMPGNLACGLVSVARIGILSNT